jgi:DNA-directed RNA polymerase subunit RPC12/RpoP
MGAGAGTGAEAVTSPPEIVHVRCVRCGTEFGDWIRPSINLSLDPSLGDPEYLEEAGSVTCPKCDHREPFTDVLLARF